MLDNRSSHVGAPRPTQSRVTHDSVAGFLARGSSLPATFPGTPQFPVVSMTGDSPLTVAGAAAALCVETHAPHSLESIDPLREPPGTIIAGVWLTIRERRRGLIGQVCLSNIGHACRTLHLRSTGLRHDRMASTCGRSRRGHERDFPRDQGCPLKGSARFSILRCRIFGRKNGFHFS